MKKMKSLTEVIEENRYSNEVTWERSLTQVND